MKFLSALALLLLLGPRPAVAQLSRICQAQISRANWACTSVGPDHQALQAQSPPVTITDSPLGPNSLDHHDRYSEEAARRRTARPWFHRGGDDNADDEDDDDACCDALEEITDDCVCNALVLLPLALTVVEHDYTINVGDACNVTFECGRRGRARHDAD